MAIRTHAFSSETRQRYLYGVLGLLFFGTLGVLVGGVTLVASMGSSRRYVYRSSSPTLLGMVSLFAGVALIAGARVPFQRYRSAPQERIELDTAGFTWFTGGSPKRVDWSDIRSVDGTETVLSIRLKGGGLLEIPADYDDFTELGEEIRRAVRS